MWTYIILIILATLIMKNKNEGFKIRKQYYYGWDPYDTPEYRKIMPVNVRPIWRNKQLRSKMWHTRHPRLVDHRYKYAQDMYPIDGSAIQKGRLPYNGGAALHELPMNLKNRWYADVNINDKNYCSDGCRVYRRRKGIVGYPQINMGDVWGCDSRMSEVITRSTMTDKEKEKMARSVNRIKGYNTTESLAANYADRSKESIEKLQGLDLHLEPDNY